MPSVFLSDLYFGLHVYTDKHTIFTWGFSMDFKILKTILQLCKSEVRSMEDYTRHVYAELPHFLSDL